MKRLALAFVSVGACMLSTGSSYAAITEWEDHALDALNTIRWRVRQQPAGDQVQVLPEFPTLDSATGQYLPVRSTFIIPTAVSSDYTISELNNAGAYCDQFNQLTTLTNNASVNITKVWTLGLDVVVQLSQAVLDARAFKAGLEENQLNPIRTVAETKALVAGLNAHIDANQERAASLAEQIRQRITSDEYQQLKDTYDALLKESLTGVPQTQETVQLQADIARLKSQIDGLRSAIDALKAYDPNNPAIAGLQSQLDGLNAQLTTKQVALSAAAAPYRQQKAADAAQFKSQKLEPYEAYTADLQAEFNEVNKQIIDDQKAAADALVEKKYLDAAARVNTLNEMVLQADELLTSFRNIRDSATADALFAINYGRTNLNDWAAIDAGVAVGPFPIWTQKVSAIPGSVSYGGYTNALANLYDVTVRSDVTDILNSPVAQLPLYNVDTSTGSITQIMSLPDIAPKGQKAKDLIEIVNPSDVAADFFALPIFASFNGVNAALRARRTSPTNATPTVRMHVTLATYCGQLRTSQVPGTDTRVDLRGQTLVLRPERTIFTYAPRTMLTAPDGRAFFETTLNGKYKLEEQFKPAKASCRLQISDYAKYVRSWGKVENNYIFWSESHSWDDTAIDTLSDHTLKCYFEQTTAGMTEAQQKEIEGFNQMAVNEVLAQFIQANARQPMPVPARVSEDRLREFESKFPRHTWAPTMMAICGGQPICDIAGIIMDNVGTAVQSSSTSVTRTGSVSLALDVSKVYAGMVPHDMSTSVRFFVRR
jgi:predicted  nucleic acid-binding Zn-ribbon protein